MEGKPRIDWQIVKAAWEQNFCSTRSVCRETGLDRSFLQDKIRDEGWALLREPAIKAMWKHLYILEFSNERRHPEKIAELCEQIKDRIALRDLCFDLVRQTVTQARIRQRRN